MKLMNIFKKSKEIIVDIDGHDVPVREKDWLNDRASVIDSVRNNRLEHDMFLTSQPPAADYDELVASYGEGEEV